jgi:formylglycine-generating enzyme required for sulfatase activity
MIMEVSGVATASLAESELHRQQVQELRRQLTGCEVCHSDNPNNIAQDVQRLAEKCRQCHTATEVKNKISALTTVADSGAEAGPNRMLKTGQSLAEKLKPPEIVSDGKKRSATDGMRYPLYSDESRLGDEPNPMVFIAAGPFLMGSNDRLPDEGPQHEVNLDSYYIDVYEVTNLQYKKFNDATKRRSPAHFRNRSFPPGKADHPVTYVSWEDAQAYCQWAGKRLPTDEEWEKAARGTDGRMFPWGNEFDVLKANTPLRWQQIGDFGDTTPVGAFADGVSPYGLYDTSGNVWEWTSSWYKAYPNNTVASESYGERYKTLKGGSWFDCSFYNCGISAPVFNRAFFSVRTKNDSFGFRCAKDGKDDKKN